MRKAVLSLVILLAACVTAPTPLAVGQGIDVKLPLIDGGEFSFASTAGKVVLVDVWASWCGPCVESMPFYADLENASMERGFTFVGINIDEDERAARAFLDAESLHLTTLRDPGAKVIAPRYAVTRMPTAFLVGRDGRIRYVHEGIRADHQEVIRREVETLLAEK